MLNFGQNYDQSSHVFMRNLFGPVYDQVKMSQGP